MSIGERAKLTIDSSLAYGARGVPGAYFPGGAALIFDAELISII